ncbi:glucokinase [Hyaloraphidium curvatum]|nr:glucokinase [Hyaloraphidium curvatum]
MVFVIVGDLGGTNSRLTLWEIPADAPAPKRGQRAPGRSVFDHKYLNEKFDSFVDVMKQFIEDSKSATGDSEIASACLACAGPILDNTVSFTNVREGWNIAGDELAKVFKIPKVKLLNDFEAMGYGLLTLDDSECHVLQDVKPVPGGVIATVGAGTGLGETFLTKDPDGNYICWPTEGGHTDWSPRTEEEVDLLNFLRKKFAHKHRVSQERVISGPGLATIYEYLSQKHPEKVNKKIQEEFEAAGSLKGGVVAQHADADELCRRAMEIMFTAYASECGNAMLKWLPTGGFYVTGGIGAKNLDWITKKTPFLQTMLDKGRVSPALKRCPIKVVLAEDCGERGAHLYAHQLLSSK